MLDWQLYKLIKSVVNAQLSFAKIPGITLDQSYQPVRQGVENKASAYVTKLYDVRFGSPENSYIWDAEKNIETKTMTQVMLSTFQITALNIPHPANSTQYTASDIANLISATLQSDIAVEMFTKEGVGILNITEIRNPYFLDDKDRWEASPSFDFTLTHKQILSGTAPTITDVNFKTLSV